MAIAVDAMGGDTPLTIPVEAAVRAVNDFGIEVVLVGDEASVREELKRYQFDPAKLEVVPSTEVVEMHESPALALRQKKDSSIRVAIDRLKLGQVDAVVSAGNTGAAMATAKFVLKSIKGVERPAIATLMPSINRQQPFVILDIGANTDCKPLYLLQFAMMGAAYAQAVLGVDHARVGLLNNGEEEGKGSLMLKETYGLMKQSTLNFYGNIEGKAMFKNEVDVVVCDGLVGNIALKVAEGTFDLIGNVLKQEIQSSWLAKLAYLGMKKPFQALRDRADYTEVGGAPLLGVNGIVIICHGSSTPHTIRNAIRHAKNCADLKLNDLIGLRVSENLEVIQAAQQMESA